MSDFEDQTDGAACWADGHVDPAEWFDYSAVEQLLGEIEATPADVRAEAAELFAKIMVFVWSRGGSRTALVRFTAITAGLRPDLLKDKTYTELAVECGVTKQRMSKAALEFADKFHFKFVRSRPDEGRKHMAQKATGHAKTNFGGYGAKRTQSKLP